MRSRVFPLATVAAIAVLILAPAIIWGGRRASDNATREAAVKVPEVSTIGPEMTPYVLTPVEREKLKLPVFSSPSPFDFPYGADPTGEVESHGPYPGMTPAELEKLAAWQGRVRESAASGTPRVTTPEREPVSTIEMVPREPGIEGLTPAEKAKLDAYLREGGRR